MNPQFRGVGLGRIRKPEAKMALEEAKYYPKMLQLRDDKMHRDRTYNLAREQMLTEKELAERALKRRKKDAKTGHLLTGANVAANLGLGLAGSYMDPGKTVDTATDVMPDVERLPGMSEGSGSVWSGSSDDPVGIGKESSSFLSDVAEPVTQATDFLKKHGGDALSAAGGLYDSIVGKLFDFDFNDTAASSIDF